VGAYRSVCAASTTTLLALFPRVASDEESGEAAL